MQLSSLDIIDVSNNNFTLLSIQHR